MKHLFKKAILASTALGLGAGLVSPAAAQDTGAANETGDIVVTARRIEERLQDVPVSVTVFNQETISEQNITTPADLAVLTPSLSANVRFGSNSSTFSIRGFAQEQRTSASVATYFGEVVAPRGLGGSSTTAGDGAGPGNLFDLQNVQVLNGPQGTLFGRNTTGGAVLLVPRRPTDELGGYAEVSGGDYDMRRFQGVLNLPISDAVRLRLGMDRQEREGYLENVSGIGPRDFNDVNYEAYRASMILDIAPNIENYTIGTYSHSLTNGTLSRALACLSGAGSGVIGALTPSTVCSDANLDPVTHLNNQDFYTVRNSLPSAHATLNVWQVQNVTSWDVSDNLTVKNIVSYGEFQSAVSADVYGSYFTGAPFSATTPNWFTVSGLGTNYDTSATRTYTEELRFEGNALNSRLNWQAGLYYEETDPQRLTGSLSQTLWTCSSYPDPNNPLTWTGCAALTPGSSRASFSGGELHFQTQAIYAQADYAITDALTFTAGFRYTWDQTTGMTSAPRWTGSGNGLTMPGGGTITAVSCQTGFTGTPPTCISTVSNDTEAPTWVLGLDYNLSDDAMLYAKYSRGYRQGGVNLFAPAGYRAFAQEELDAYEVGGKFAFDGPMPGVFNIAAFYNDLSDAQLQTGFVLPAPTTAILSGDVTTYGLEISANAELFEGFNAAISYGYLNSNVDRAPNLGALTPTTVYIQGQSLYNAPENKLNVSLNYRLPAPETLGEMELGASWSWVDKALVSSVGPAAFQYLNSYEVLNLNFNWNHIGGAPLDGSIFVTNALDAEYNAFQSGSLWAINYEVGTAAPPRMIGARLRYSFGGEAD